MSTKTKISGNITRIRQEKGITQVQLASRLGITQATVSSMESGRYDIRMTTLERVADALGVQIAEFFTDAVEEGEKIAAG